MSDQKFLENRILQLAKGSNKNMFLDVTNMNSRGRYTRLDNINGTNYKNSYYLENLPKIRSLKEKQLHLFMNILDDGEPEPYEIIAPVKRSLVSLPSTSTTVVKVKHSSPQKSATPPRKSVTPPRKSATPPSSPKYFPRPSILSGMGNPRKDPLLKMLNKGDVSKFRTEAPRNQNTLRYLVYEDEPDTREYQLKFIRMLFDWGVRPDEKTMREVIRSDDVEIFALIHDTNTSEIKLYKQMRLGSRIFKYLEDRYPKVHSGKEIDMEEKKSELDMYLFSRSLSYHVKEIETLVERYPNILDVETVKRVVDTAFATESMVRLMAVLRYSNFDDIEMQEIEDYIDDVSVKSSTETSDSDKEFFANFFDQD